MTAPELPPSAKRLYDQLMVNIEPRLATTAMESQPTSEALSLSPDEISTRFSKWADALEQYELQYVHELLRKETSIRRNLEQQQENDDQFLADQALALLP